MTEAFSEISDRLKSGKVALFCGAGISYNSGVPLVYDIKSSILARLNLSASDQENMLKFQMPFELFMETVLTHSGEYGLFNLFEIGRPNTNHFFIAELCRLGLVTYVATTNFDNHLETAMDELGVSYQLFYTESDFEKIGADLGGVCLLKLHGSVHDRDNIAITIKKVASKQLIAYRKKVIDDLMHTDGIDSLLFIGYSFSDIFDVVPNIQKSMRDGLSVYNIDHQHNYDYVPQQFSISAIKDGQVFGPAATGAAIKANTDYFVSELWQELVDKPYEFIERIPVAYEYLIEAWYRGCIALNPLINYYLPGQLLNTMANNSEALNYFQQGLALLNTPGEKEADTKINFLYAIGLTYREMQTKRSLQSSLRFLYMGLKLANKRRIYVKAMALHQSIGIALADKSYYNESIRHYEDALRLARRLSEQEIAGKCLGNIGIVLKNMAKNYFARNRCLLKCALHFQKLSLEIAEDLGDKRSEGRTWGNIGVTYSELGEKREAISCYEIAEKISDDLNDILHQGIWAYNIGYDYIGLDNEQAKTYIQAAKTIFLSGGWEKHIGTCDDSLAEMGE